MASPLDATLKARWIAGGGKGGIRRAQVGFLLLEPAVETNVVQVHHKSRLLVHGRGSVCTRVTQQS